MTTTYEINTENDVVGQSMEEIANSPSKVMESLIL